jgi:HEAT repeat protein
VSNGDKSQSKPFDALNTRGLATKREYVRELIMRGDQQSMLLLVECLGDESWYLRGLAEDAFLGLGDKGAPVILPLLTQGLWFTRVSVARVLGRLGHLEAVPALFTLTDDGNDTVAEAARDAVVAIGAARGAIRLARALHRMPPDLRRRRLDEIAQRDRVLIERIDRMMRNDELMSADDATLHSDDAPAVRASEDGVEWEVLTGPPSPRQRAGESGSGHA